jgi:nitrite reductase/ring-hydroxylating ferredoxin subunit
MRNYPLSRLIFYLIITASLVSVISCSEKREEYIPYRYVDFTIDININNSLTSPNTSMIYQSEGFGGVIVYCWYFDSSAPGNSIYYAFDAACTLEVDDSCRVVNEGNNNSAECPCCHTQYDFSSGGYPIKGEALYPLKSYKVSVVNNKLYIRN